MEVVNESKIPGVGSIDFLNRCSIRSIVTEKRWIFRTLSVAIFIHSSKFELITSMGTLTTGVSATDMSCCFCLSCLALGVSAVLVAVSCDDDGPAAAGSALCDSPSKLSIGCASFALLRRLRFSASSSFILTALSGTRLGLLPSAIVPFVCECELWYTSLTRFLPFVLADCFFVAFGVASKSELSPPWSSSSSDPDSSAYRDCCGRCARTDRAMSETARKGQAMAVVVESSQRRVTNVCDTRVVASHVTKKTGPEVSSASGKPYFQNC